MYVSLVAERRCFLSLNLKCLVFLTILLVTTLSFGKVVVKASIEFPSASTAYTVKACANCSAIWSITYSVPLLDSGDLVRFEAYIQNLTASRQEFLDLFEEKMTQVVEEASNMTGRSMSATDFDMSAAIVSTPATSQGTVTYRFLWVGFLEETAYSLIMGDVFEGGLYLYENDSITVIPPTEYRIDFVSPQPDHMNSAIVWHGPRNFASGEPAVEFVSMETKLSVGFNSQELTEGEEATVLGSIEPPVAVVVNITYTKPDGRTISQIVDSSPQGVFKSKITVDETGTWKVQASWAGNNQYLASTSQTSFLRVRSAFDLYNLAPFIILSVIVIVGLAAWIRRARHKTEVMPPPPEDDEEKVLALLRSYGGHMFQKDIGLMLKFSKSKTTAILNSLEAKGAIEKVKKGRRYIVRLR